MTDYTGLIERLRTNTDWLRRDGFDTSARNAQEAADAIKAQAERIKQLEAVLEERNRRFERLIKREAELSRKDVVVSGWWSNLPDAFCREWNEAAAIQKEQGNGN